MTEKNLSVSLSKHPFFSDIGDSGIEFLAQCANERMLSRDEILFHQGDRADHFYLIRDGRLSVYVPAISGPELEMQNLGAGDILGWSWLIAPYRWHFQARALEDSIIIEFDGRLIMEKCEHEPAFGYKLLKLFAALMAERLSAARQTMMDNWNPPGFA